jgi:uncharacterized DUF497 family protein
MYIKYVWDKKKNEANIRNHGIDFADVPKIFEHPTVQNIDSRFDYGEERWIAIGLLTSHIMAVVIYVEKTEDTIRIISARKANKYEEEYYKSRIKN